MMSLDSPSSYDDDTNNNEAQLEALKALQTAKEHILHNTVIADSTHSKCVDGGYRANEAPGAIAMAGGDLGISLTLLAIGYNPQKAFAFVRDFKKNRGQQYGWHTDQHEGHGDCEVGCGHCNAAIKHATYFGIKAEDARELLRLVREEGVQHPETMECVTLYREHIEKGILVVLSPHYSVKPRDEQTDNQYFIYDKTRHDQILDDIVNYLAQQGENIDKHKLKTIADQQTNATLGILGSSKGKAMYSVIFDENGENPTVQYIGNAPIITPKL